MSENKEIRIPRKVRGWVPRGKAHRLSPSERERIELEALALGEEFAAGLAQRPHVPAPDWSRLGRS
jgi:hypothetical protein